MPKIASVMGRAQAYLRAVKRGEAIFGPALLLLLLLVVTVWIGYQQTSREAAGQEKAQEITVPVAEPAAPLLPELTLPELPKNRPTDGRPPSGIPGLSQMDVIGELQYLPGSEFRCPGATPDRGRTKRTCTSSSEDDSSVLKVTG